MARPVRRRGKPKATPANVRSEGPVRGARGGTVAEAEVRRRGDRALSGFNFFIANVQTGFGPFVAVYLTAQGWTLTAIGTALAVGTATSFLSQLPAGALVDAVSRKARVAGASVLAFLASALLLAASPLPLTVYLAKVLHGFSSCTLGPSVAALSIAIAGRGALGERLGRNARYASLGSGAGAALMGACGYYFSERAVFYLTALLALPALALLPAMARAAAMAAPGDDSRAEESGRSTRQVLADRRLLVFAVCALLFTFVNAPLLPIASSALTANVGALASPLIAACIVLPQLVVALVAPWVGRAAGRIGRKPLLLAGFAMLPVRALALALVDEPLFVVLLQALDGVAAACFGVLVPLVVSDIAGRSGHFNLSLGAVGLAIGIGGTVSPPLAGWIGDGYGNAAAFAALAGAGVLTWMFVALALPETRPDATPSPVAASHASGSKAVTTSG
jgi:MFS family permease